MFNLELVRKLGLKKKYDHLVVLPLAAVFLLIFFVVIFGLGLDKRLTSSSVAGYIIDDFANPVINALVCIDEQCSSTSAIGYFRLDNLTSGEKEISVTSPNHNDISQRVRLSSGANPLSLSLTTAELTNTQVQISSSEDILYVDDLSVTLAGKAYRPSPVDPQKAEIAFAGIKTGAYLLKIESDYYIDQELELVFEGGEDNNFQVILNPAAEFHVIIVDWLDNSPVHDVGITVDGAIVGRTNGQGRLFLSEIGVNTQEIKLSKEEYLEKKLSVEGLEPGQNTEITAEMIPERKITFTKSSASGSQIFISNYDGSGVKQITTSGINQNPWIDEENERVYFQTKLENNRDIVKYTDFFGEVTETLSSEGEFAKRLLDEVDYKNDSRFFQEGDENMTTLFFSRLDDSSIKQIYSSQHSDLESMIISKKGDQIVYKVGGAEDDNSLERGIFHTSVGLNRAKKILDQLSDEVTPHALFYDNSLLAVTVKGDIFVYTFADKSLERLTSDNTEKSHIQFFPEQKKISYLSNNELFAVDVRSGIITKLSTDNVSISEYRWEHEGIFSYKSNENLYIASIKNFTPPQLVTESADY